MLNKTIFWVNCFENKTQLRHGLILLVKFKTILDCFSFVRNEKHLIISKSGQVLDFYHTVSSVRAVQNYHFKLILCYAKSLGIFGVESILPNKAM